MQVRLEKITHICRQSTLRASESQGNLVFLLRIAKATGEFSMGSGPYDLYAETELLSKREELGGLRSN